MYANLQNINLYIHTYTNLDVATLRKYNFFVFTTICKYKYKSVYFRHIPITVALYEDILNLNFHISCLHKPPLERKQGFNVNVCKFNINVCKFNVNVMYFI